MGLEEEQTLIEQAKSDPQSFGILFDNYYQKITNYILHRVGDIETAQEISSITFFKAWQSVPKYEVRGLPFSAWLYRIASNEVNTYFRKKKYHPLSLDALFEDSNFEIPSDVDIEKDMLEYEDALSRHDDFKLMSRLLKSLPTRYQEVTSLRFFEKKSIDEIAGITGKKTGTVKSLLSRGTKKLQKAFLSSKKSGRGI